MRILYIDCKYGAAGDMFMAALSELVDDPTVFDRTINCCGVPGLHVRRVPTNRHGAVGTAMTVEIDGIEEEAAPDANSADAKAFASSGKIVRPGQVGSLGGTEEPRVDAVELLNNLPVAEWAKQQAAEVYTLIRNTQAKVHGRPVSQIHYSHLGSMDAVADILGTCLLLEELNVDRILSSPVNVGGGYIRTRRGILPVPAPVAADLLQDIPHYSALVESEMCTPTGAALLNHFVDQFVEAEPEMKVLKTGYGIGKKDFGLPAALRIVLAEANPA